MFLTASGNQSVTADNWFTLIGSKTGVCCCLPVSQSSWLSSEFMILLVGLTGRCQEPVHFMVVP
uniref:Uncharacterized protein n=1 Tax=Arundo donax TaxID=35708 RepID=A0A0A8ZR77_ARUDO